MTQHELIIRRLKRGWCTGLDALQTCGTMKLATRVSELRRAGYFDAPEDAHQAYLLKKRQLHAGCTI